MNEDCKTENAICNEEKERSSEEQGNEEQRTSVCECIENYYPSKNQCLAGNVNYKKVLNKREMNNYNTFA